MKLFPWVEPQGLSLPQFQVGRASASARVPYCMETPLVSLLIKGDSPKELPKGQKKQPKQTITCGNVLDITVTLLYKSLHCR